MSAPEPQISIVMAAYNRAHTLRRAVDSVLRQTDPRWELIIVDDGSKDDTLAVAASYDDPRIRIVKHERNRGVCAAKNSGFDAARAPWVTTLDSDDEAVPNAVERFLWVAEQFDPTVDAVSCNCLSSVDGNFTGKGLDGDGYINVATTMTRCRGEAWGMFHQRILQKNRLDERLYGMEGVLWTKIHEHARWYYLHEGLRIYHTEGDDRISRMRVGDLNRDRKMYQNFATLVDHHPDFYDRLQRHSPSSYLKNLRSAAGQLALEGDARRLAIINRRLELAGEAALARSYEVLLLVSPLLRAGRQLLHHYHQWRAGGARGRAPGVSPRENGSSPSPGSPS